jgi:hypothetical protein
VGDLDAFRRFSLMNTHWGLRCDIPGLGYHRRCTVARILPNGCKVDAELRDIYRLFLVECGFAVKTTSDGVERRPNFRRLGPDLLMLDQELLWGGGEGLLAWMRESAYDTPVGPLLWP